MLSRFSDRDEVDREDCYRTYFEPLGLPRDKVLECLELIEIEFDVPFGLLRPTDKLSKLFEPIATKNPLRWLEYRTHLEDSQSELEYELGKRMRQHGTFNQWSKIETIEDFVRAWCGVRPSLDQK